MYEVGEEVFIMSSPGVFRVVAVEGEVLTIESAAGLRKTVLDRAVRRREKDGG